MATPNLANHHPTSHMYPQIHITMLPLHHIHRDVLLDGASWPRQSRQGSGLVHWFGWWRESGGDRCYLIAYRVIVFEIGWRKKTSARLWTIGCGIIIVINWFYRDWHSTNQSPLSAIRTWPRRSPMTKDKSHFRISSRFIIPALVSVTGRRTHTHVFLCMYSTSTPNNEVGFFRWGWAQSDDVVRFPCSKLAAFETV
jgi:hypothetical protein